MDRGPSSYSSKRATNLQLTATIFCRRVCVCFQYFHFVRTRYQLKKYQTYIFTRTIIKRTSEHILKAKTETHTFILNLSIAICFYLGFPVISANMFYLLLSQEKQLNFHEKYCQFSIGQYTSQRLFSYIFIYGITTYQ